MSHPLARIFAPISMIFLMAIFTVAIAIVDINGGSSAVATAATQADRPTSVVVSRATAESP